MDTRGQGGRWTTGAAGDQGATGGQRGETATGPENAQVMTRGITRPEGYYYTRLFTDAVLAVETASELAGAPRVAVSGVSQGGGSRWLTPRWSRRWSRRQLRHLRDFLR
jgi:cephalosporin-C deacetylase